jgi:hypothetical protein
MRPATSGPATPDDKNVRFDLRIGFKTELERGLRTLIAIYCPTSEYVT